MKRLLTFIFIMALLNACTDKSEKIPVIGKASPTITDGRFTPEIMHSLGKVSDPQISPDGTKILYGVSYTSIEQNKSNRELFVMNIDGTDNKQITFTARSESNARWIDGGAKIVYLHGGQLWVMNNDGSSPKKVSNVAGGIMEFKLSPDESRLLYSTDFKVGKKAADIYPDIPKSTARTIEGMMYRHWDHFVETIPHTYIASFDGKKLSEGVDILDGAPYELPAEPFSGLEQLDWSPDGKYIVYSCRKLTGRDYAFSTNSDIYLYNIETKECRNLSEGMMGYDTDPVFSPDGGKIAWLSMERDGYEADKVRLFVMDLESNERKDITDIQSNIVSDRAPMAGKIMRHGPQIPEKFKYNVESPVWMPNSQGLYFSSLSEGLKQIWKIELNGVYSKVTPDEWFDFGAPVLLTKNTDSGVVVDKIITTNTSMMRPAEIVSISVADGRWSMLTNENGPILDQIAPSRMEQMWIPTTDGKKMLTWVVYPPDFDSTKVYPSILLCLGGPQGTLSQGWSYRWNYKLMASQGYIVVLPNRRGTTAFGQEWCEQISGDYIGQNMKDYFSAADALKAKPYVGKMAAVGASYGGYSVYYLAGIHKGRFSAFIAHAGIFNQEHMYMSTEEMWFPNWDNGGIARPDVEMSGAPWSDNPVAKRHYANSPHKLIKNWDTPILVTHGELDYRVPVDQGMAAFNAAQMMGVPSKMILFPDENHWILKPQNSIHWNREFFAWLDKYTK
ncbi:MAG: S9 family peptidase [Bacteroidales bacterium]|nr:S9 family peptidase [Bacteroidales bacterium]MDD4670039.1 S9 family peptidase [Bacteroidales bacterium]